MTDVALLAIRDRKAGAASQVAALGRHE